MPDKSQWADWMTRLRAISESGLVSVTDPFDIERYQMTSQLAGELETAHDDVGQPIDGLYTRSPSQLTPIVDVRGVVFKDGKLLLVKEREDGRWTLPGGWADVTDTPARVAEREVLEEAGYQVRAIKLLAIYDRDHPRHGHPPNPQSIYKMFFLCELQGGAPTTSIETEGVGFFALDNLPELSVKRVTEVQIRRLFDHLAHPNWPTEFD